MLSLLPPVGSLAPLATALPYGDHPCHDSPIKAYWAAAADLDLLPQAQLPLKGSQCCSLSSDRVRGQSATSPGAPKVACLTSLTSL